MLPDEFLAQHLILEDRVVSLVPNLGERVLKYDAGIDVCQQNGRLKNVIQQHHQIVQSAFGQRLQNALAQFLPPYGLAGAHIAHVQPSELRKNCDI